MPETANLHTRMGLVAYCLGIHQKFKGLLPGEPDCSDPLGFLEKASQLEAGGVQFGVSGKDEGYARRFREKAESSRLYFEAIVVLPKDREDLGRFEKEIAIAREAGASVARTTMLPGRRYEQFNSLAEYQEACSRALRSLEMAEPVAARHKVALAIENHKDHRLAEKIAVLRHLSSEFVGACVDVGNNLSLLEDSVEVVRGLAPWAKAVHIKDQALRPCADGFLLADAAMGEGMLDLPEIVRILRRANPAIHFSLEVITRDPLKVPVLTEKYWATLGDVPASDLAGIWNKVRTDHSPASFAPVSELTPEEQIAVEERNVETSLKYAKEHLNL